MVKKNKKGVNKMARIKETVSIFKKKLQENIYLPDLAYYIMENMPEYSLSLKCTKYNYDKGVFVFKDVEEDGKEYIITNSDISKALTTFFKYLGSKWRFSGIKKPSSGQEAEDIAGDFDAEATDAVIQIAIFGDIIYG
jgi:alpha-mannosidase